MSAQGIMLPTAQISCRRMAIYMSVYTADMYAHVCLFHMLFAFYSFDLQKIKT